MLYIKYVYINIYVFENMYIRIYLILCSPSTYLIYIM